ncbi:hypothetical protein D2T29_22420 [Sinirhodobacter populi]|uniref:Uncharacterized protein n=1 Tax=Paenirhodobacter populi TaxID=2306993 RepID=A0A443JX16_9RHOB|nr:hypothetical protein [Sinirhodobacter populi]RWR25045.1 hypothetical protein D2T29_22420 [Sinirhodobacter populi]
MNTQSVKDIDLSDFTTQVDDTYHALRAFTFMLDQMHEYAAGKPNATIGYGIGQLLRRQVDDFEEINSDVYRLIARLTKAERALAEAEAAHLPALQGPAPEAEDRIREIICTAVLAEASRPAWHDLDTIAARSRVHRSEVARVLFVLTGEDHDGPAYRAWDGNLSEGLHSHLLTGLCWAALARCDMWAQVSAATGIDLMDVKKVLNAMLEYSPKREAINLRNFEDIREIQQAEAEVRARVAEQDAQGPASEKLRETLEAVVGDDPDTGGMSDTIDRIVSESDLSAASVARVVGLLLDEVRDEPEEEPAPAPRGRRKVH